MPFVSKLTFKHLEKTGRLIVIRDETGVYSTTNPDGYGDPNPIQFESISFFVNRYGSDEIKKSCQRCFQAIRIDVNNELEGLYSFLEKLPSLHPG